jgi:imidazoleglycerol-phosphate dehydratase
MTTKRGSRFARVHRKTRETDITVELNLDGAGVALIATGMPFLNHMLELLARHALLDLKIRACGDLAVDYHHTVEDIGLACGEALNKALGDRRGITRYGSCHVPMDEALSRAAIDLGGRPFLVYTLAVRQKKIRDFDLSLLQDFFQAFCVQARMNLHVAQLYGRDAHHAGEAMFKAVARALQMACAIDPRVKGVPSSKGKI